MGLMQTETLIHRNTCSCIYKDMIMTCLFALYSHSHGLTRAVSHLDVTDASMMTHRTTVKISLLTCRERRVVCSHLPPGPHSL